MAVLIGRPLTMEELARIIAAVDAAASPEAAVCAAVDGAQTVLLNDLSIAAEVPVPDGVSGCWYALPQGQHDEIRAVLTERVRALAGEAAAATASTGWSAGGPAGYVARPVPIALPALLGTRQQVADLLAEHRVRRSLVGDEAVLFCRDLLTASSSAADAFVVELLHRRRADALLVVGATPEFLAALDAAAARWRTARPRPVSAAEVPVEPVR